MWWTFSGGWSEKRKLTKHGLSRSAKGPGRTESSMQYVFEIWNVLPYSFHCLGGFSSISNRWTCHSQSEPVFRLHSAAAAFMTETNCSAVEITLWPVFKYAPTQCSISANIASISPFPCFSQKKKHPEPCALPCRNTWNAVPRPSTHATSCTEGSAGKGPQSERIAANSSKNYSLWWKRRRTDWKCAAVRSCSVESWSFVGQSAWLISDTRV